MTEIIPQAKEQPSPSAEIALLPDEKRHKAELILKDMNITDSQFVLLYGASIQNQIASFTDAILDQVKSKDSGQIGLVLSELISTMNRMDVNSLSRDGGSLSRIPLIGNLVDTAQRFIARYEKLGTQIDQIVDKLEDTRIQLLKDISILDSLYEKNLGYMEELDLYILAGKQKLEEVRCEILPGVKAKADTSADLMDVQHYNDMVQIASHFEKKLSDLQLSRTIAIQTLPQIRLIQMNNQAVVEKVQSSILNTIPLWKNQIVIAISILRQKKALELQREVTDTTNNLLKTNAKMLKENSIEIAQENERGIVDLDTLKKVNDDLISTIEETLKIQQDARAKRNAVETEIAQIEKELRNRIVSLMSF